MTRFSRKSMPTVAMKPALNSPSELIIFILALSIICQLVVEDEALIYVIGEITTKLSHNSRPIGNYSLRINYGKCGAIELTPVQINVKVEQHL